MYIFCRLITRVAIPFDLVIWLKPIGPAKPIGFCHYPIEFAGLIDPTGILSASHA